MKQIELNYYAERYMPLIVFNLIINKVEFQFSIKVFSNIYFKEFFDEIFQYLVNEDALTYIEVDILLNEASTIQSFIKGLELIRASKEINFRNEFWKEIKKYSLQNDLIEGLREREINENLKGIKRRLNEA